MLAVTTTANMPMVFIPKFTPEGGFRQYKIRPIRMKHRACFQGSLCESGCVKMQVLGSIALAALTGPFLFTRSRVMTQDAGGFTQFDSRIKNIELVSRRPFASLVA
jgi:hypothetical protein